MWVRVNLSSLPAELYPHIWFAVRQLLYYSTVCGFVKGENKKTENNFSGGNAVGERNGVSMRK